MRVLSFCIVLTSMAAMGCAAVDEGPEPECRSFLGEGLHAPELPDETRSKREAQLAQAEARLADDPGDVEAMIWVGRRTAYLGRYNDAIAVLGRAIEIAPDDARLYRHRGHRYITLRKLDQAIEDLERASTLIAGKPDQVEPDGLPNARNIPTSTLQSNIWYHLGLAYYLKGDFEQALRCYRECLDVSRNPDMLSATSHWLYMTLRRLGRDEEARSVLELIDAEMEIVENRAYHELLLMYKGERDPEDLWSRAADAEDPLDLASVGYGVGNWYLVEGETQRAREIFERILEAGQWPAFGHLAAEAELAHSAGGPSASPGPND
jgi:tetratricopeptide (TPR) repeat protein